MIRACLFLLAGVYALQLSSFAANSEPAAVAMTAFVAAALTRGSAFAWFFTGLAVFAVAVAAIVDSRLAPGYEGDSIVARVRIADFPRRQAATVTFLAEPVDDERLPGRLRVSWFEPPVGLRLGDVWEVELRLRRPRGQRNPGVFDYETWLFRARIGATGYVVDGHRNRLLRADAPGFSDRVRRHAVDRIVAAVPDRREAAVLAAVTVGARHLVTRGQWDRYARTGTSHLMAISGLHIGLAAAGSYLAAGFLSAILFRRGNHRATATICSLAAAMSYAWLSGLAVPAQRATLMIAILAVVTLRRREVRPFRILATTCVILVMVNPVDTLAPGFRLSFGAVFILAWMSQRLATSPARRNVARLPAAARQLLTMQVLLLFGLLPLTVAIFGRLSLASLPVNVVAVPTFSLVTVPFALVGLLLDGPLSVCGDALIRVAAVSLRVVHELIEFAANVPAGSPGLARPTGAAAVLLLLPTAWTLLPPGWPGRHIAWLGVAAILAYAPPRPATGCAAIAVLDVGQGLAVVIRTSGSTVVYDTGPAFQSGGSAAETVILPYLQHLAIDSVNTLIVSHADLDHAGGLPALRAGLSIGRLLAGEPRRMPGTSRCRAGDAWQYDGIDFEVLHPPPDSHLSGNDASCVLLIAAGHHRVLLAGDIEKAVESELVRTATVPAVAVVVVPHHGSRTSSTPAFVDALRPDLAIVAAGYDNRWGFPKRDVVNRWRSVGADVADTATSGAISLTVCAETGFEAAASHREAQRRIWHE